ncbi:MAG: RibD family protein [Verrucomicrobia bacterium]|jgi:2,5-diamino-6-(ribosylamino)-4(3H)-pyrimidinone 5'-phosphate reductase|nr:RibD family protein [Verrucomicrobiota bacterium]
MRRPRIFVNFAITVDGKVTTVALTPSRFTSSYDKRRLLEIRSLGDALLVGRNTVQTDNMSMGLPDEDLRIARLQRGQSEYPLRVLISNSGNLSTDLNVFNHHFSPIVIYSTTSMPEAVKAALQTKATLHLADGDRLRLSVVLSDLYETYRVRTLVCEGGPSLAKALAEIDAIDELFLTVAPLLFGGASAPGILGNPGTFLPSSRIYRLSSMNVESTECYLHYVADRR